ncbi:MAG: peptidase M24, partial [Candidatus Hydrogenedentes bacterium]|nr:peptidase M24 [Candidatus Hydrogenedentota bacterium]
MIRKDKFDYVLPGAMRRNGIDMWIVMDHGRGSEPMMLDFGIETAYGQGIYVFFDGGGDRIERILVGGGSDLSDACGAYDQIEGPRDLRSIVHARDPQRIALNFAENPHEGEGIRLADGLSYTDYKYLEKELGEKYVERFVSAQHLIADFHGERVASEI